MSITKYEAELELKTDAILGEGPVWDAEKRVLYWVDILSGKLFEYNTKTGENKVFEIGEHLGAVVIRERGGLVLALQSGFAFFNPSAGKIKMIADPEPHLPGNRFNDGKCDPAGRFWAGTMSYDLEKGKGSLYCLHSHLTIERKLTGVTISNGLAWNKAANTLYFIDTLTHQLSAFDYDIETGNITNRRIAAEFDKNFGYPDGMAMDEKDKLWVAFYNGSKVIRINPEGGEISAIISLPVPKPTSCAFGGEEMDELYITTCREHMSKEEIEQAPLSGSLFKVSLPVKGLPVGLFSG
ncbi:MAG: SMP-30/gluconolactonase/LRE family protein [Balneolaceae bacterium]|nr:MAG: SMP-30/gluconolactonase/LRE family protein [Balneolaceae bacterium]